MRLPNPSAASVKSGAFAVLKWIVSGGLLIGLILAVTQCTIERDNARTAAVQTYNMGRVAAFRDSGAELDKKVATFNDAVAEGRDPTSARQDVRSALADHAAKTMAMKDAFGDAATTAYSTDLKALQSAVEQSRDPMGIKPIVAAMSRVIVQREKLANDVTKKATS